MLSLLYAGSILAQELPHTSGMAKNKTKQNKQNKQTKKNKKKKRERERKREKKS